MLSERQRLVMTKYLLSIYIKRLKEVEENYQYFSSINNFSSKSKRQSNHFPFNLFKESFLGREISNVTNFMEIEKEKISKEYKELANISFALKNYIARCENKKIQEKVILNEIWKDYLDEQQKEVLSTFELNANNMKLI